MGLDRKAEAESSNLAVISTATASFEITTDDLTRQVDDFQRSQEEFAQSVKGRLEEFVTRQSQVRLLHRFFLPDDGLHSNPFSCCRIYRRTKLSSPTDFPNSGKRLERFWRLRVVPMRTARSSWNWLIAQGRNYLDLCMSFRSRQRWIRIV